MPSCIYPIVSNESPNCLINIKNWKFAIYRFQYKVFILVDGLDSGTTILFSSLKSIHNLHFVSSSLLYARVTGITNGCMTAHDILFNNFTIWSSTSLLLYICMIFCYNIYPLLVEYGRHILLQCQYHIYLLGTPLCIFYQFINLRFSKENYLNKSRQVVLAVCLNWLAVGLDFDSLIFFVLFSNFTLINHIFELESR